MSWQKVKLGALYEVHNGLSKPRDAFGDGFPFLSYSTVFNNFFLPDQLDSLVRTDAKEQESYSIKTGDVFITRTSETSDELGMSCVALKDYPSATYNGFCKRLRPVTDKVLPKFIGYYLRAPEFRSRFDGLGAAMITRASLKNEDLLAMTVKLPAMPVQRKIADILGAYDDLIENNRRRIALLEKMSRELYRERFVRRYEKTGNVVRLGDVCSCLLGGTPSRNKIEYWNGDVAWINSGKVNELRIVEPSEYITEEGLKCSAAKLLPRKTTVLAITGATLGQVSLLEIESAANQSVIGVVQNDRLPYTFIYPLICENIADLIALQTGGAQQHINKDNVESMEFDLPNEIDVGNYHKIAAPMYDEMAALLFCNINLARQRDRLLPRLMSGKIDLDKLVKGEEVENG